MNLGGSAAVVGSGPNGLAAAVTLARAGIDVTVFERSSSIGGGAQSVELFESGVWHDECSAFELERRVALIAPEISFAQADGERMLLAPRELNGLDGRKYRAYVDVMRPLRDRAGALNRMILGGPRVPQDIADVIALADFARALMTFRMHAGARDSPSAALLAGASAHSALPVDRLSAIATGTMLAVQAHVGGWPVPQGGSRSITRALYEDLIAHGGKVETGIEIKEVGALDAYDTKIFSSTPQDFVRIAKGLPLRFKRQMNRFRFGASVQKFDFLTSEPIPWGDQSAASTATVHLGDRRAISRAERDVEQGRVPDQPFVLLAQADLFDKSRTVPGRNAVWCYTHLPRGGTVDQTERVVDLIEKYAPGFRDTIVAQRTSNAADLEARNPNYVGGDILSGRNDLRQLVGRPRLSRSPWRTPLPGCYLASASTYPGSGVHGMAGYQAAILAIRDVHPGAPLPDLSLDS
jgi:phytoene dehydrogenase-like protein